jgi:hypothetical protein
MDMAASRKICIGHLQKLTSGLSEQEVHNGRRMWLLYIPK